MCKLGLSFLFFHPLVTGDHSVSASLPHEALGVSWWKGSGETVTGDMRV